MNFQLSELYYGLSKPSEAFPNPRGEVVPLLENSWPSGLKPHAAFFKSFAVPYTLSNGRSSKITSMSQGLWT